MSNGRTLSCMRCGAPIPSGFECAACAAPRATHTAGAHDDPTAEPVRSDAPKLVLSGLLALVMVGVLVYGGVSGSASMRQEKADVARQEAAEEAKETKEEADRKADAERVAQTQSDAQADSARQERKRKDAQDLADLKAEADAGLNVAPPSASSFTPASPTTTTIQCALCHGTGTLTEQCGECHGDGEIECAHCEAYNLRTNRGGDPNCPDCGGASHLTSAVGSRAGGVAFVYTCPRCHGTEEETKKCPYCHGSGTTSP